MRYELSSNITLEWKKQALTTLAYTANSANTAVKSFIIQASCCIHDASFSLQLTRLNKLESYITLGWAGLPGTKTLAYWAPS